MSIKPAPIPSPRRLRQLAEAAGTPRVLMLGDLAAGTVTTVSIEWDDQPDVVTRCTRAGALVALVRELQGRAT